MTSLARSPSTQDIRLHAGQCGEWPPEPTEADKRAAAVELREQLEAAEDAQPTEVAQGWDSLCPRPMKRGNWDALPDDVQERFDTIDLANREQAGLTANFSQLSKGQRKRHCQKLRGIQDRLCAAARDLWVREAKSILLNADREVVGVAEYQGARWAVELVSSITARIGTEHAIPQGQPSRTSSLLATLEQDGAVFLEAVRAQMAAGDVQHEASSPCDCCS